jgi:stage V sporulation protein R
MGLAYEIVINSNPCIAYLMEENTMTMQALVIAHAAYGHNSFFKGNYLFRTWTDADAILDYLLFARNYISRVRAAPRRGSGGRPAGLLPCPDELRRRPLQAPGQAVPGQGTGAPARARRTTCRSQVNDLWRTLPTQERAPGPKPSKEAFPPEPQENLLYFIEKNAPLLEPWQREIVRIVRKIAQYFYPQRQTQVMNEGWATFWHYTLLNHLYDEGKLTDGFMMEFLQSHTNVVYQPPYNSRMVQRHQPLRPGLCHVAGHPPHLRAPHRRRPPLVPGHRRQPTG